MKYIAVVLALFSLSACSIFKGSGDKIVFDTATGPSAKAQAQSLPSDLRGDNDNARYSSTPLVGADMGADQK